MKPSDIQTFILNRANAKRKHHIMLWGAPGSGKTEITMHCARQYGNAIMMRLTNFDQVDLRGIPVASGNVTKWLTPDMLPQKGKGIIVLDEMVQATPGVQAAAGQLLDGHLGDYTVPPGYLFVATGNRDTDRAATNRMPSHIANRFTHIDFEVDLQDWLTWADGAGVNEMVKAFLMFKPTWLHQFDPKQRVNPTCRTWEIVSDDLNDGVADGNMLEILSGTIGAGAAVEFVGFIRVFRELPDYDSIKKRPTTVTVPQDVAVKYALAGMLSAFTTPQDMGRIMQFVERLPDEFQILCTQEMTRKNSKLAETSAYIGWCASHKDLLLNATIR